MMYKPPYLQKYAGKSTRFTCPGCKTPHSFTRYLDGETHLPIHPTVGRCNREIKCGYHYTPRQYFADLKRLGYHAPTTNHLNHSYPDLNSPISPHSPHPYPDLHSPFSPQSPPPYSILHSRYTPHPPQATAETIRTTSNLPQHQNPVAKDSNHLTSQSKIQPPVPHSPISPQPSGPRRLQTYPEPRDPFPLPQPNQSQKQPDYIPHKYLKRSLSLDSNFVRFLRKHFSDLQIAEAANNYLLGATIKKEVIFWQVDIHGKVRTGKIMQYNPQTGRRIKTGYGGINWVHHKLKKSNPSFSDFNLSQCYFGEHLLRLYPDKPVAIVEAEKTAVIASMIYHDYNWLAAGNLNGLNVEKSRVLRGKTIILYPDAGCYDRWLRKAEQINRELPLHLTVSAFLEHFSTPQQSHLGYDLADYII